MSHIQLTRFIEIQSYSSNFKTTSTVVVDLSRLKSQLIALTLTSNSVVTKPAEYETFLQKVRIVKSCAKCIDLVTLDKYVNSPLLESEL